MRQAQPLLCGPGALARRNVPRYGSQRYYRDVQREYVTLFGAKPQHKRGPRDFGPVVGCLVGLPLLLMGALLSVPYLGVFTLVWKAKERLLTRKMEKEGRVVKWGEFLDALDQNRGTLIAEWETNKGPVRLWWTPDDIYGLTPYPCGDHVSMSWFGEFSPFRKRCFEKYASPTTGNALLVLGEESQKRLAKEKIRMFRTVEIVPPRKPPHHNSVENARN